MIMRCFPPGEPFICSEYFTRIYMYRPLNFSYHQGHIYVLSEPDVGVTLLQNIAEAEFVLGM
jgi:hypothetical protein